MQSCATREHPLFEEAVAWLRAHKPEESAPGLCWGDPRPGNMIWQADNSVYRCLCVTDFEAASIAPPEVDFGWWLMFDRTMHECAVMGREMFEGRKTGGGVGEAADAGPGADDGASARLPGDPTREEQRRIYERHAGREIGDTLYWEILAGARYAAIVVRVMNRAMDRGHMPKDQIIWLHNPATAALTQLMALRP